MISDDDDAGSCIRDLGFPYIHGCLAEAGIWKRGKGLWIALDYAGQFWWPETLNEAGSPQAATARSLVELMTLLELDKLVPGSRSEMRDLLSGTRTGHSVGVISYITVGLRKYLPTAEQGTLETRAKVGYTGPNTHGDTAIVQHASKAGDVHYTVALLNAVDADTAEDAARALDIALVASRLPPPPPPT